MSPRAVHAQLDLLVAFTLLAAVTGATSWVASPPASYFPAVLSLFAVLSAVLFTRADRALPPSFAGTSLAWRLRVGLGPANRVTLARAMLVLPMAGLLVDPVGLDPTTRWWIVSLSTVVLVLDGVDGRVARRTGSATAFGARFDMELDAFLMLVLSLLVWLSGQVGPWVIGIGGLRYLFVAGGVFVPRLRSPLPPSLRRKTVCVIQGAALLVCLAPVIPTGVASVVAALALALLVYSFAVDVRWLLTGDARPRPDARNAGDA